MQPLWFLALPLALLPLIAWWRPHAIMFSSLQAMRGGHGARPILTFALPLLECVAIALVVTALARPQEVRRETVRESEGIDILLAIDTSGSMDAEDMGRGTGSTSRLEAAKQVMARFVEGRPDDRLGLLVFGEEAFIQVPLTLDHEALTDFVGQLVIGMAGRNKTAVGTAIAIGCKRMKDLAAPSRIMILVTDGHSNAGSVSPLQAADAAKALGVRVYTIGVGSAGGGGLMGMLRGGGADVDEPTLRAVAARTGGKYYRATDASALAGVYEDIDKLERTTARTKEFVHRDERYLSALLPGLALILLQLLLGNTLLRRIP